MINGVRCKVAGEINMDKLPVEVPEGVEVAEGDPVLIGGSGVDGELTFEQWAAALNIPLDLMLTAPPGRTRVIFHDGIGPQAPPINDRAEIDPRWAMVRATTNLGALPHNLDIVEKRIRARLPPGVPMPKIMFVLKADAYGNDARLMATVVETSGVEMIGCVQVEELLLLRAARLRPARAGLGNQSAVRLRGGYPRRCSGRCRERGGAGAGR